MPTSRAYLDMIADTLGMNAAAAETTLAGPVENAVTLQTPEPATPRALPGAPDDRELGLAIAAYPCVPPHDGAVS